MNNPQTTVQKQFWTLNKVLESDCAYNIVSPVKIEGKLNIEKLHKAWIQTLKTIPLFNNSQEENYSLNYRESSSESEALTQIQNLSNTVFNLDEGLPVKAYLISINETLNYFIIIQHHILTDLHSKNLLSEVFSDFYNTGSSSIQIDEYKEKFNSSLQEKQTNFWKQYLHNAPESLVLPSGKEYRGIYRGSGSTIFNSYSINETEEIETKAAENMMQPFLLLLVSYSILISRLSGQKEFFIGIPFSNRRDEERKQMYGPFINILPLHISISDTDNITDLYQNIRKNMLLLHRNQEIPFQEIVQYYKGKRETKIPYLIQVGFTQEGPLTLNLENLNCT